MALRVGLTGGIGSGKSTVARIFQVLGVPVYYADDAAKDLMDRDPGIRDAIINLFGAQAYQQGKLNRKFISDRAFDNPALLEKLNAIVHPATLRDAANWMQKQQTAYSIKEAALIFESGSQENLDYVIGVSAPTPLRIRRAMERDKVSREDVLARMRRQIPETIKMRLCNFVIYNDEQQLVIQQVLALHDKLMALAKEID